MANTLIPAGTLPETNTSQVLSVAKNKEFLSRLKLCGSQAGEFQRGLVGLGHFALIKTREDIKDVGDSFDILIVAGRSKAVQLSDPPIQSFNPDCALFKDLQEEASKKDTEALFGPEFLLYLPDFQSYATYFLCNATGRVFAPDMLVRVGDAAILSSYLIETKKYKWHGPALEDCGEPLEIPPLAEIAEVGAKFLAEKDTVVEVVEDGGRDR